MLREGVSFNKPVIWTTDASGAAECAGLGYVTVIVDVIDMSTSLEACRKLGAIVTLGASPITTNCPVEVNPAKVVAYGVAIASRHQTKIILVTEPRTGSQPELTQNAAHIIEFINKNGGEIDCLVPNIGSEIANLADFKDKVVIGVTATGGTAFDAAFNVLGDERVTTATIARIKGHKSKEVINMELERIIKIAGHYNTGIGFVAASKNSLEDVLGAQYLAQRVAELIK